MSFPHREVIGDTRTFIAAQKFKKILQLGQNRQAKNVPWFSMTDVSIILSKLSLNENIFVPSFFLGQRIITNYVRQINTILAD